MEFLNTDPQWAKLIGRDLSSAPVSSGPTVLSLKLLQEGPGFNHLDSYERFLRVVIPQTLLGEVPLEIAIPAEKRSKDSAVAVIRVVMKSLYYSSVGGMQSSIKLPYEAALASDSYAHTLFLDLSIEEIDDAGNLIESNDYFRISLGNIATLVFSSFCTTQSSPTGTFIEHYQDCHELPHFRVKGHPKVMIASEESAPGRAMIHVKQQRKIILAQMVTIPKSALRQPNTLYVRATNRYNVMRRTNPWIVKVRLPYVKCDLSIVTVFRAIGCKTDREICELLFHKWELQLHTVQQILDNCFRDAPLQTEEEAQQLIAQKAKPADSDWKSVFNAIIHNDTLAQFGSTEDRLAVKRFQLASIVRRLILVACGLRKPDDRDNLRFKRVLRPCDVLSSMCTHFCRRLRNDIKNQLKSSRQWDPNQMRDTTSLERAIRQIISQGRMSMGRPVAPSSSRKPLMGLSGAVDKLSFLAALSQSGKVKSATVQRDSHQLHPREQHGTQTGAYCPIEVTDGQSVGLTHALTCGSHISVACNAECIERILSFVLKRRFPTGFVDTGNRFDWEATDFVVTVDGAAIGRVQTRDECNPRSVLALLRTLRTRCIIPWDISVAIDILEREISVWCDGGRMCSLRAVVDRSTGQVPAWTLDKDWLADATFTEIKALGDCITTFCAEEMDTALIRPSTEACDLDPRLYTHAEVSFSANYSVSVNCLPGISYNQSCRNTYGVSQSKQGIGPPLPTADRLYDVRTNSLFYSQSPMATTSFSRDIAIDRDACSGVMAIVAIVTDPIGDGDSIEDPIIVSKRGVDFGMFHATTFTSMEGTATRESAEFRKPDPSRCVQLKRDPECYNHINPDGTPKLRTKLSKGDVAVGRETGLTFKRNGAADNAHDALFKDTSILVKEGTKDAIVHAVHRSEGNSMNNGAKQVKVMLRQHREPIIGSKFASRHGMKGVLGKIAAPEDMPFTEEGIVADIYMNPQGKISRMSWAEMFEALCSRVSLELGKAFDFSVFNERDGEEIMSDVRTALARLGIDRNLETMLYSGITGKPIGRAFVGPIFVQLLKHMVQDKIHARWRGPRQVMTEQPTGGKSRDGGLKIGEMEFKAIEYHGTQQFIKERLELSDMKTIPVCRECGFIAVFNGDKKYAWCPMCKRGNVGLVALPKATQLWIQEMLSINVAITLKTKPMMGIVG